MRTEIERMQHSLEKEATTSPSINADKATSIDVKPQTSEIPAEPQSLAEKKDECEIAYINTKINDVYNPLNNNVDWLSTRIDLLQQDLDTIRKKNPQPATSIDIYTITSIDSKFAAMEDSAASLAVATGDQRHLPRGRHRRRVPRLSRSPRGDQLLVLPGRHGTVGTTLKDNPPVMFKRPIDITVGKLR
ncbi:hypothetical protein DY000_02015868 [Brassica cretica]|uniref:Uncharacterized protein n=1 Tax=Brassica cretica TaxID=69181 RepID=A0ABQ7DAS5_BRACR|nr:hypothetical protein DY000_02015868 [Brassica cretica]